MRVALFIPCLVDRFLPDAGRACTRLLESAGVTVHYDPRQTCCGQPAFNAGHPDEAAHLARRMLSLFDGSLPVVAPSGSCVAMVREGYGNLELTPEEYQRWDRLRSQTFELSEFLLRHDLLDRVLARRRARVLVHHACHHLRHVKGGTALERLLERLRGATVVQSPQAHACCGFGGFFSTRLPELSVALGATRLEAMLAEEPDLIALADGGCILHLRGIAARREDAAKLPPIVHYAQLFTGDGLPGTEEDA